MYPNLHTDGPTSDQFDPLSCISETALEKLESFCNAANKSTGSHHPCDEERWFDFICQTVEDERLMDYSIFSNFLMDEEYWGNHPKVDWEAWVAVLGAKNRRKNWHWNMSSM